MNMKSLKDKVIIVTGASSGIGEAMARLYAAHGAKVVLCARSEDKLKAIVDEIRAKGGEAVYCVVDVVSESDCKRLVDTAVEKYGGIDVLICNAGLSMRALFDDVDLKVLHRLMDVNFWGTVNCTKYALPWLLESRGSVVGVISIAGYSALPARTGYSASKYAVRGFLDTLRIEHLKDGLNVLVFAPGYTSSNVRNAALTADGSAQGETPLEEGKLMSAEAVAEKLAKALRRRRSEVILTALGKVTVLAHRLFPRLTDRLTYSYIAREAGSPFK